MFMFNINNIIWNLIYTTSNNPIFIRSDGSSTVGVTDNTTNTIYISSALRGAFLERVLCHELCHAICFSYDLELSIQTEEVIADWVSLYGKQVISVLDELLKNNSNKFDNIC